MDLEGKILIFIKQLHGLTVQSLAYFGEVHGKYAIVVLVILICLVVLIPLLLLSYPYLPKLLSKLRLDKKWIVQTFFGVTRPCQTIL